jgi:hypothetical protein
MEGPPIPLQMGNPKQSQRAAMSYRARQLSQIVVFACAIWACRPPVTAIPSYREQRVSGIVAHDSLTCVTVRPNRSVCFGGVELASRTRSHNDWVVSSHNLTRRPFAEVAPVLIDHESVSYDDGVRLLSRA